VTNSKVVNVTAAPNTSYIGVTNLGFGSASPVLAPVMSKACPGVHELPLSRETQAVGGAPVLAVAASAMAVPSELMTMPGSA